MDLPTLDYYARNASDLAKRYESVPSPVAPYFSLAFPSGSRVLDVGAGSGRDLAALIAAGFDAYGVEPSDGLRSAAIAHHPELTDRLCPGALPQLGTPFGGQFDGILCSAVLMHLSDADLFDAALALRGLLKSHGRLLISLPSARTDVGAEERDANGRLFKSYAPEEVQLLFERIGFRQIGRWDNDDALQRTGTRWYTLLLELSATQGARAIDQIEGILNRDRKVATYKFALFRALAEIATQEPRAAQWRSDGRVGIPIDRIARRWLLYYWPLFASQTFVPQSQAEGKRETQGLVTTGAVAFRAPMRALMAHYAEQGQHSGLTAWFSASSASALPPTIAQAERQALQAIAHAIKSGPVTHAGGALEGGAVFDFDSATKTVVMHADLWRELSLLGHWIIDAVTVRWAALTERFAVRQGLHAGDVLPLLMAKPDPGRSTLAARGVYLASNDLRCVWSLKPVKPDRLAVDHVIPFALWSNSDLWNLQPADTQVNGNKSDKLPSAPLLLERREEVILNWQRLREALPVAFDQQATNLLGKKPPVIGKAWEQELFARLREAVEITALQRGVERWGC